MHSKQCFAGPDRILINTVKIYRCVLHPPKNCQCIEKKSIVVVTMAATTIRILVYFLYYFSTTYIVGK